MRPKRLKRILRIIEIRIRTKLKRDLISNCLATLAIRKFWNIMRCEVVKLLNASVLNLRLEDYLLGILKEILPWVGDWAMTPQVVFSTTGNDDSDLPYAALIMLFTFLFFKKIKFCGSQAVSSLWKQTKQTNKKTPSRTRLLSCTGP